MMMMSSLPEGSSIDFYGEEMSEVVSHCLPHRQLCISNLSRVAMQWFEPATPSYKAQNIPLDHRVPPAFYDRCLTAAVSLLGDLFVNYSFCNFASFSNEVV